MRIAAGLSAVLTGLVLVTATPASSQSVLSAGGLFGFQDGMSFQAFGVARDFAEGLPFGLRVRLGRTAVEPGSATQARRIFINNATNGTPEEKGRTLDMGLDAIFPRSERTSIYAGVRYTSFKANFKYVGGNEDFDVVSSHWGLAAGLEGRFPMASGIDLVMSGGIELFRPSRLQGHDTSYSPDGDDVNPREDYEYSDADDAVSQPSWRPVALVGFSYRLGR